MEQSREMIIQNRYIHLPVKNGLPKRRMRFFVNGKAVRSFDIELADEKPDFWVFSDVGAFEGQRLAIEVDGAALSSSVLEAISQGDRIRGGEDLYQEKYRPQFHFSSRRGWHNDPNGLMYYRGEYHLPAQPLRRQAWQHALGACRQRRPGALARAGRCPLPGSFGHVLFRGRRGRWT